MREKEPVRVRVAVTILVFVLLLGIWFLITALGAIPAYMLPTPIKTLSAIIHNAPAIVPHLFVTLNTVGLGYFFALIAAAAAALLMHGFKIMRNILYPLMVVSQTVPLIVLAPLLILWFGFGISPKVFMVVLVCFFPVAVNLLDGMDSTDPDILLLFRSLGAGRLKTFIHAKLPAALPQLFAGLKIAAAYSIIGAVISEWLGGTKGLGVYMVRAQKAFAIEKLFAAIVYVVGLSLLVLGAVTLLKKICTPWMRNKINS